MEGSLETTGDPKQVCIPQETNDDPFDLTLVIQDGKEFKAHRRVLAEASPFFKKLLNSDMKESNEGVVRLEMLAELAMRVILEFIYTGSVEILAEENYAQELIAMADYLDLLKLKIVPEKVLFKNLKSILLKDIDVKSSSPTQQDSSLQISPLWRKRKIS